MPLRPPLCALPAPTRPLDRTPPQALPAPVGPQATIAAPALPADLDAIPFVQHVAASGARITDLGMSHGLRAVAARSSAEFMLFDVTPDGQAAVAGAMTDLSAAQLVAIAAGNVSELGTLHGLRGLFVRSGSQFQVFYATPDGARVIPGVMWDAAGKDITRDQVAHVPGAIPTVVVGGGAPGQTGAPAPAALPLVERSTFGTIGPASAPHLWMLIDPQCIYSVRAFQMLEPYTAAGRVQISVIPLAVLDYEDHGQSTKSALALLSKPADQIVAAWRAGDVGNAPAPQAAERLQANMAVARAIHLRGTPTFIWRKPDGSEGRIDGLPSSVPALLASIGS